jgi:hypothetical protein
LDAAHHTSGCSLSLVRPSCAVSFKITIGRKIQTFESFYEKPLLPLEPNKIDISSQEIGDVRLHDEETRVRRTT